MAYNKTEKEVLSLLSPIVKEKNIGIWDIEFKKEGKDYFLRVFLDKEGGISIDDCEYVSRALEEKLDEEDPISQAYMLEVSSAGLDRIIKYDFHFEKCMGKKVDVKLFAPLNGQKEFTAVLEDYKDGTVTLAYEKETISLSQDKISQLRLTVEF
ncbi:MAG: ribosome maturation factor RimP [Clostridia bacterium]|nr:ribosome maturation factor RimP [Clostridia bacterium]